MYTRVESCFWQDEKMRGVSDDARYLMLYFLTSPHRNILGFYFLPSPYACFDLGWDEERFNKGLRELLKTGRIKHDPKAHIVLISNYLKHNPLENPNQVKSAIDKINELPQTALFQEFLYILEPLDKPFLKPLLERLSKRLPKPVTESVTVTVIDDDDNNARVREAKDVPTEGLEKSLVLVFEQEFARLLSPLELDQIASWQDKYSHDLIIEGLRVAVLRGIVNCKYIDTTLHNWEKANIRTVQEARAEQERRREKQPADEQKSRTMLSPETEAYLAELDEKERRLKLERQNSTPKQRSRESCLGLHVVGSNGGSSGTTKPP